jgi:hypothetical protein
MGHLFAITLTVLADAAIAASLTLNGLTFSDELGGVRLLEARGSGSRDDPIVLVEEITGADSGTLIIRNHRGRPQRSPGVGGYLLLSVVKIVTNRGPWRWSGFELELRTAPGSPSVYTDGLSFDQPQALRRPASADRFPHSVQEDEPFDLIRFDGGSVDPSARVQLRFDIVDVNAAGVFYLIQRPIVLMVQRHRPRPETSFALVPTAATP